MNFGGFIMGENYITCYEKNGSINISDEVVSSIVRAAVSELEGVAGLSNTSGAELVELIGIKSLSKGIKIRFNEGKVTVDAIINVSYGQNIVEVAKTVQEKILNVVQTATGIDDVVVNVHVSGVAFEK